MNGTEELSRQGTSIWLDYLSRSLISSGELQKLIDEKNIVGVTTNPSIFQKSITESADYDLSGFSDVETAVWTLISDDVRNACDVFKPIYDRTNGVDGRVSIEVDPRFAHDFLKTRLEVERLFKLVDRENVMIKIPAIKESLPAITEALSQGISVNVTLIFSHERYREVIRAFVDGIEAAKKNGHDITKIHSVASFFVSRIDTLVDGLLEQNGSEEASALRGKIAVSYAQLAYGVYEDFFNTNEQWAELEKAGAHRQRPLWASTGTKNPIYSPTIYVDTLAFPDTVNTMPEATLDAVYEKSDSALYPNVGDHANQQATLDKLEKLGVSMPNVVAQLEKEGVEKFIESWEELLANIQGKLD
jgi:transaldolase